MTTISLTYDRAKTCHLHPDGRLLINGQPEQLDHASFPHSPPHFQEFLERQYQIHHFRILPKNRIVTEGRTSQEGREWEIDIGVKLSRGQKSRAWLAYKERVVDTAQLPSADSQALLAEACIILKNNYNVSIQLTTPATNQELLQSAKLILEHTYTIFISIVETQRTFLIRNSAFNLHLDLIARSCTAVYANVYKATSDVDADIRREAIYGLQGTQLGHEVTWTWLNHLVDTDQISEAINRLCELAPTLLETEAMRIFCCKLAGKITSSQLFSFVIDDRYNCRILLTRVKNLLCGQAALLAFERGDPEAAVELLHSRNVDAPIAIQIANHFVAKNELARAITIMFPVTRSIEIQQWFVSTADKLWTDNKYKQALLFMREISSVLHHGEAEELWRIARPNELCIIDVWYLRTAEKLWIEGEIYQAMEIVKNVRSLDEKDKWFLDKGNMLFREGAISEAAELVEKNCSSQETLLFWLREKADVLLERGKVGQAYKMITLIHNATVVNNWCTYHASQLIKKSQFPEAVRFVEYSPMDKNEKDNWFTTMSRRHKEIRREPENL